MNTKKSVKLEQIGVSLSKAEKKQLKKEQKLATEPSFSNYCRKKLTEKS